MTTAKDGWIEAICGPMFSGKSEELIRRLHRAQSETDCVQAFKPTLDNRYSESQIVSHANVRMHCETVGGAGGILARLKTTTQVVGVDEANFFGAELVQVADALASQGKQVIIAGLDTDFLGRPFVPMPELLAIAEVITKLHAVCARCGAAAKHSQRLLASRELIVVGASGTYEARCRACFDPGKAEAQQEPAFVSGTKTFVFRRDET